MPVIVISGCVHVLIQKLDKVDWYKITITIKY